MAYDLEIRAGIISPKFVTLSKYEYERRGANHGMYTITFHTFDLESETLLSNDDIFKYSTLDKVTSQLLEVMAKDSHYAAWNGGVESGSERKVLDMDFELPEGALTYSGVVFSFQPYEIGSWAAGTFHFIVPYEQLMPYLTPRVKAMIRE